MTTSHKIELPNVGVRVVLTGPEPREIVIDFDAEAFEVRGDGTLLVWAPSGNLRAAYAPGSWFAVDRTTAQMVAVGDPMAVPPLYQPRPQQ